MTAPFVVFGLPRSRTYWLSRFLACPPYVCYHDQAAYARSADDVAAWLTQPCTGTVETAGAAWWRLLRALRPDVRLAVVRRDPAAVIDSLMRFGWFDRAALTRLIARQDRALDRAASAPDCLSVRYEALADEAVCAQLFTHCLGMPPPAGWWAAWAKLNLQRDLRAQIIYARAHARLMQSAAHDCLAAVKRACFVPQACPEPDADGVVIRHERFADFYRDGAALMAQHCRAVGDPDDQYLRKDIAMFERVDRRGHLMTLTARLNGRMLGYLISIIVPSFEEIDVRLATQMPFYVDPDAAPLRLGMRLQRAAIIRARQLGARRMYLRAGTRGDGPRLSALYRRLGAHEYGQYYELDLAETG